MDERYNSEDVVINEIGIHKALALMINTKSSHLNYQETKRTVKATTLAKFETYEAIKVAKKTYLPGYPSYIIKKNEEEINIVTHQTTVLEHFRKWENLPNDIIPKPNFTDALFDLQDAIAASIFDEMNAKPVKETLAAIEEKSLSHSIV